MAASGIISQGIGSPASIQQFLLLGLGAGSTSVVASGSTRETSIETEYYLITVAEISELQDITDVLVWDADSWSTGQVWG